MEWLRLFDVCGMLTVTGRLASVSGAVAFVDRLDASASRKRWLSSYLSRPSCVIKPFYGQRATRAANVAARRVVGVAAPMTP